MSKRPPIFTLLALSTFGCVIDPGVLEGDDEVDAETTEVDATEADTADTDTGETGDALLAECLLGTNASGGSDPEDFPVDACELTCDAGWGHEPPALAIAWTLHFEALEPDTAYFPIAVVPREGGDGVIVVSRREAATELLSVSATGAVLDITSLPTQLELERVDAWAGVIHLAYYDEDTQAGEVVAIDELGQVLWSKPRPSRITGLAAVPEGGVIVGSGATLTRFGADGSIAWSVPAIEALSIEVSAQGNILVGGHQPAQPELARLVLYSDLGVPLETHDVPGSSARLWDLHFLAERRFYASGTEMTGPSGDGSAMVVDLDDPDASWTRVYNRALDSCDQDGELIDEPTWDWFGETAMLSDGTLLVVGAESGPAEQGAYVGIQPRVLHLDQQGEFLAGDRGLWFGQANAVAAGADGSAYAALMVGSVAVVDSPLRGFYLRKYLP